ncbi:uncharacterized protein LOC124438891 [Xenia sp. Carnegie-2017]|uniref:uncharacterized protein LOC124438891 n=1 Tax=Xenia sp. Carnegie-2017 TaxID=2897299 RepID=UPI001F03ACFA|nr:uncharacterized protein LOC124438891 [Xenia sp. Carnegie-2017]
MSRSLHIRFDNINVDGYEIIDACLPLFESITQDVKKVDEGKKKKIKAYYKQLQTFNKVCKGNNIISLNSVFEYFEGLVLSLNYADLKRNLEYLELSRSEVCERSNVTIRSLKFSEEAIIDEVKSDMQTDIINNNSIFTFARVRNTFKKGAVSVH